MPNIQLEHSSRIEFALNLTTDVLLALLKHPELASDPLIAHRAVNIAVTTMLAFEQSGVLEDPLQRDHYARIPN